MKFLVLVLSFGAVVIARPDVSHLSNSGYYYKPPSTSYGVPVDNGYVAANQHHHHHHVVPSDSYGVPLDNKYTAVPSTSYLPGNVQLQLPNIHSRIDFLGSNSGSKHEGYNSHLIQDQKHVYYYAVPDDEEPARLRIHVTPSNKKNTNVIFVKAPSYAPAVPEVIVPQHQAEEKTKVIVLVKKPEHPTPISIPAPAPVKSKPEVYVVKYENQEEAERVLSGGRGGHPIGFNVHNLGDEASFVSAIKSDIRKHIPQNDKYSGFDGSIDFFGARSGVRKDAEGSSALDVSVGGGSHEGSVYKSGSTVDSFGVGSGAGKVSHGTIFVQVPVGGSVSGSQGSVGTSGGGSVLESFGVRSGVGKDTTSTVLLNIPVSGSASLGSSGGTSGASGNVYQSGKVSESSSFLHVPVGGSVSSSLGISGNVRDSGSVGSFGVQVEGSGKSDKSEVVVDSDKKNLIEIVIGDEKSEVDINKDVSYASGSIGVREGFGGNSDVKNTVEIKTIGQEHTSPLLQSFGKSAIEIRTGGGESGDSVSESSLSGSITAGTEKSSVVDVKVQGVPFSQYGPPS